jgi:hypothetical protein
VKVTAGRSHGAVAERGLDEVNGRPMVQRVAGVGVAEPVGANLVGFTNSSTPRDRPDDAPDPPAI